MFARMAIVAAILLATVLPASAEIYNLAPNYDLYVKFHNKGVECSVTPSCTYPHHWTDLKQIHEEMRGNCNRRGAFLWMLEHQETPKVPADVIASARQEWESCKTQYLN